MTSPDSPNSPSASNLPIPADSQTTLIAPLHFRELSRCNPTDVCRRSLCRFDEKQNAFILTAWNAPCVVHPHEEKVSNRSTGDQYTDDYFGLFIVHYLLGCREKAAAGEWISEKETPGGAGFFRGPHEVPTFLITKRFGEDITAFQKRCETLHGTPLHMADAAYRFEVAPRIPVAALFWEGDDEFPPEAKLLFDRTVSDHLPLDIIFALAVAVCQRIEAA